VSVPPGRAEEARAVMLELFPEGFEERGDAAGDVVLAAYTDGAGEERLWQAFGGASGERVEDGWEDRWREFHRPARVGPLWLGPPWETAPPDAIAAVIDPGRAFGTGGHATTRLCLELMLGLERAPLLDVGCGSGILSICAVKLGFQPVVAVDVDPVAVEVTRQNALANDVAVDVRLVDATADAAPAAHVAVANIALEVVELIGPRLECELLVTSGYLESERPRLPGFEPLDRRRAQGWAADLFGRTSQ
jgi:ribosomal protein L11 methyltransferase